MATSNRMTQDPKPPLGNSCAGRRAPSRTREPVVVDPAEVPGEQKVRARAASDDAHVASSGASATAAVPPAASPDRGAYADVARVSSGEVTALTAPKPRRGRGAQGNTEPRPKPKNSARKGKQQDDDLPPGMGPLPDDVVALTEALHTQVDFLAVGNKLLRSPDERIVKGVWENMLELRYGKEVPPEENARRIVIDVERPHYDPLPTQ
jgi:hypothetical protein